VLHYLGTCMEVGRLSLKLVELPLFVNAAVELPDQVVGVGISSHIPESRPQETPTRNDISLKSISFLCDFAYHSLLTPPMGPSPLGQRYVPEDTCYFMCSSHITNRTQGMSSLHLRNKTCCSPHW